MGSADNTRLAEAFRQLNESQRLAHIGSWYWNAATDNTIGSDELLRIFGFDPATQTMPDFKAQRGQCFPVPDWERINAARQETLRTGIGYELEVQALRKGEPIWIVSRSEVERDKDGRIIGLRGTVQDITERKKVELALQEQRELLNSIIDSTPAHIFAFDQQLRCTLVNAGTAKFFDLPKDAIIGKTLHDVFPKDLADQLLETNRRILATGEPLFTEETVTNKVDSVPRTFLSSKFPLRDANGRIIGMGGVTTEITERKQVEEERRKFEIQMVQMQKLESLGVLAGGIAHDFNNLLTSILGYCDLALLKLQVGDPGSAYIRKAIEGSRQAAELINQMLAYSGKGNFVVEPINLSALVEEMVRILQISISKKCVIKFDLLADPPAVNVDVTQIRQVVMNLIMNASDAIGDRSGIIVVSTGVMHCDHAYLAETYLDPGLPEGMYVHLEVADNGCGMSAETRGKIFDPFFTTKHSGRGLGLAAVLGIVRGHKGALKCYSELGKGTTFKLLFPATQRTARTLNEPGCPNAGWRGSGTVLLIEDEETVRAFAQDMLTELGFSVLVAADGREGVERFREHQQQIRLVLMDMTMPHLDGVEAFREIRRVDAHAKVVLMSGYNEQSATSRFTGKGLAGFIRKPFSIEVLISTIQKILEG